MKSSTLFCSICCALILIFITGCDQKDKPLKEGTIWNVRWVEYTYPSQVPTFGFYRTEKMNPGVAGLYGQDMYGVLYPTFLEVRFVGNSTGHAQIIPLGQIVWLEFGDGGVKLPKPDDQTTITPPHQ